MRRHSPTFGVDLSDVVAKLFGMPSLRSEFHFHLGGAIGRIHSPNASAEIEGEESELVSIDTPLAPQRDLIALLKQTTAVPIDQSKITLRSFFVAVDEERFQTTNSHADHVRELMDRYQGQDESKFSIEILFYQLVDGEQWLQIMPSFRRIKNQSEQSG